MVTCDAGAASGSPGALGHDEAEAFHRALTSANIARLRTGAVFLLVVESLVVALERILPRIEPAWQMAPAGGDTTDVQVAMVGIAVPVLALLKPTRPDRITSTDRWATLVVLAAWVCLAASIPGFRQEGTTFAWPYVMAVALAAVATPMTRHQAEGVFVLGYAVFVASLLGNENAPWALLADVLEGTVATLLGIVVSRAVYGSAREGFAARRLIERQRQALAEANEGLRRARDASDALLCNILPEPVADRLKSDQTVADHFDQATVLFADVVDFTPLCQGMPPEDVVRLLDTIFSAFDDLAGRHGLEKIKTIGDAYMATAGLPTPRPDHAPAAALMCLDMRDLMPWLSDRLGVRLQLRLGMASGPAVAGVIGKRRLIYDLWGDTVNTAFRMEARGVPGEIQVAETTYDLLRQDFILVEHGSVEMKGKGPVMTYLLKGRRRRDGAKPEVWSPPGPAREHRYVPPSYWDTAGWRR